MRITRNEIRTGVLVVVSLGVLVAVLLFLGAPGVFKQLNTYRIFFDNAAGIKPGAPVLLAGRQIGQVTRLFSPVPPEERPEGHPEVEALIELQAERAAPIYRKVTVRMQQNGLLGEMLIDFAGGDPASGLAADGAYFHGERVKDFAASIADAVDVIKDVVTPVALEAQRTMEQLKNTASNLQTMTAPGSNIDQTVLKFRDLGTNLAALSSETGPLNGSLNNIQQLTGEGSPLDDALENIDQITSDLIEQDRINLTLTNVQRASENLNRAVNDLSVQFSAIGRNTEQMTDTLKRQPWRLIWPTTKKYPEETPERGPRLRVKRATPVRSR